MDIMNARFRQLLTVILLVIFLASLSLIVSSCSGKSVKTSVAGGAFNETAPADENAAPRKIETSIGEFALYTLDQSSATSTPNAHFELIDDNGNAVILSVILDEPANDAALFRVVYPESAAFIGALCGLDESDTIFLAVPNDLGVDFGAAVIGGGEIDSGTSVAILKFVTSSHAERMMENAAGESGEPASGLGKAAPEGGSGRVNDLAYHEASNTLTWSYVNKGDYDQSGEVGIADITPIATHYQAVVGGSDVLAEVIDGDNNGEVGISDITPIAENYLADVSGYSILRFPPGVSPPPETEWGDVVLDFVSTDAGSDPDSGRRRFSFQLLEGQDGEFYVAPRSASGPHGELSNKVVVVAPVPPSAPTGLAVETVSDTSVTLIWDEMPPDGEEFRLYMADNADMTEKSCITQSGHTTQTFTAIDLSPETEYFFCLTAANDAGESEPSDVVPATTDPSPNGDYDYEWLFMVYIGGDNNLAPVALIDINEMELVGSTDDIAIAVEVEAYYEESIAQLDTVYRFKVVYDDNKAVFVSDAYENNMTFPHDGYDSTDPANILDFANWAKGEFNARQACLVLWDHGGSWFPGTDRTPDMIIMDDTEGTEGDNYLIAEALADSDLDIIMFDACNMGGIEVADAFAPVADWLMFSENFVPWDGFNYDEQLAWLAANPTCTPKELSNAFSVIYVDYYRELDESSVTMSTFDSSKYPALKEAVIAFREAFTQIPEADLDKLREARSDAEQYGYEEDRDLLHFLDNYLALSPDPSVLDAVNNLKTAAEDAIYSSYFFGCENDFWGYVENANGLMIWLPGADSYQWSLEEYESLPFDQDTVWSGFLGELLQIEPPDTEGGFEVVMTWGTYPDRIDLLMGEPDGFGERDYYWIWMEYSLNGIFGLDSFFSEETVERYKANDIVYGGDYAIFADYTSWDGFEDVTVEIYDANDDLYATYGPIRVDADSTCEELPWDGVAKICEFTVPLVGE